MQVAADASGAAESVKVFWERCGRAWERLQAAAHEGGGQTVAVVTHSSVISGILCRCLDMGPADLSLFRTGGGSITLIGFPGVISEALWGRAVHQRKLLHCPEDHTRGCHICKMCSGICFNWLKTSMHCTADGFLGGLQS